MITLGCVAGVTVFFEIYGVYTFCQDISRHRRARRTVR